MQLGCALVQVALIAASGTSTAPCSRLVQAWSVVVVVVVVAACCCCILCKLALCWCCFPSINWCKHSTCTVGGHHPLLLTLVVFLNFLPPISTHTPLALMQLTLCGGGCKWWWYVVHGASCIFAAVVVV